LTPGEFRASSAGTACTEVRSAAAINRRSNDTLRAAWLDGLGRLFGDEHRRREAVSKCPEPWKLYGSAMTRDDVLDLCARLPGAVEDYPFGDDVAVFKVGGRMFALVALEGSPGSVNLKCDPELALELRAEYSSVHPGYHQNKRHWNTVELDGSIEDDEFRAMIDHSYQLVVGNLTRAVRARL
jgi:predicted DNA-binding protein (MmcQ/YjbR family)